VGHRHIHTKLQGRETTPLLHQEEKTLPRHLWRPENEKICFDSETRLKNKKKGGGGFFVLPLFATGWKSKKTVVWGKVALGSSKTEQTS